MSGEHRPASGIPRSPSTVAGTGLPIKDRRPVPPSLSDDTRIAVEIRDLVVHGSVDAARERFAELVAIHQRRALRIAYQYLHDAADADEAVQDAFVKAYGHIESYREAWPFEVWFTRILINGCLDRRKARMRRARWFVSTDAEHVVEEARPAFGGAAALDPESRLLARRGTSAR
jgi:DNA-directed RNA polymerase specialized sigma24 family protein